MTQFSLLRRQAGVSIPELATQLGISEGAISNWEEGAQTPPCHVLKILDFILSTGSDETPAHILPVPTHLEMPAQQHTFSWLSEPRAPIKKSDKRTGTFTDNMKLPVHRWFRYSAGFSAEWVERIIDERRSVLKTGMLFDPFAGSATSLIAAQTKQVPSAGAERHPFVCRVANAKLSWDFEVDDLRRAADSLLERARNLEAGSKRRSVLLEKCYSPEALARLEALRRAFELQAADNCAASELLWLALTSILRECSAVGTAQWQYVLPNKTKARVTDPFVAFGRRIELFCSDMRQMQQASRGVSQIPILLNEDARSLQGFADLHDQVSLVVTSPPYPNNYDYADATRLEMTFWGEVSSWGDLQHAVRRKLVRSCSQHSAAERLELSDLLADTVLDPIRGELSDVCLQLEEIRLTKGGKKTYHTMVAAYFADLARAWHALRPLCTEGAEVCFVIGDSAPYGIYVPVDKWLASLAEAAGFHSPRFEKIRDRNLKWKNRKHRVPLKEGNLWLRG